MDILALLQVTRSSQNKLQTFFGDTTDPFFSSFNSAINIMLMAGSAMFSCGVKHYQGTHSILSRY